MMELRLLGGAELRMDDGADPAAILAHPKRLALLAYLAAGRPFGFHQRDALVGLLWPHLDQIHARAALRQTLHRLRQSVEKGVVVTRGDEGIGVDETAVWCDVRAFDEALGQGRPEDGLALYRGDLLPGVFDGGAPEFERWIESERRDLRLRATRAAWLASDRAQKAGNLAGCTEWARRAVRLAPDDEPAARRLITLLEQLGDRAGSSRVCHELERYLTLELEVEPSAETAALFNRVREKISRPVSLTRDAPAPVRVAPTPSNEHNAVRSTCPPVSPNGSSSELEVAAATATDSMRSSGDRPVGRVPPWSLRSRLVAVAAAVAVLASSVVMSSASGWATAPLPRVAVLPLDNRTANVALDPVGMMAADWIERGLLNPGVLEVVPAATVQTVIDVLASNAGAGATHAPDLRTVSKQTGAGLLVSGAYYTTGDRIRFELVLNDAVNDRIIVSFAPVVAAMGDPTPAIDTLRTRVAAAVAQATNVKFHDPMGPGSPPPSRDAYQLYINASAEWRRGAIDETERILRKALAIDPNYQAARVYLAVVLMNKDELAETDSLLQLMELPGAQLSASEHATVTWMRGLLNSDSAAAVRAFEDLAAPAQSQVEINGLAKWYAMLNLPRKGLATMKRGDPRSAEMQDQSEYWWNLTDMYDALGEHDLQLLAARKAREQFPDLLSMLEVEARALAALGRSREAEDLVKQSIDLPQQPSSSSPGVVAREVAYELRAQGDTATAKRISAWGVRWYERLLPDQQLANRSNYADALYAAERWRDSWNVRQDICHASLDSAHVAGGSQVTDVDCLGWAGLLAARLHQPDAARKFSRQLSTPHYRFRALEGHALRWRAQIAAVLGDREEATNLLRRAIEEAGAGDRGDWHRDPDLRLLRGYPPYEELMRPKG